jgi:hypothetical protein
MLINQARSVSRELLAGVVVVAVGLSMTACGSPSINPAATTEPVLHAFVGRFAEQPALKVALLVGRDSSVAYICDNHRGGVLLRGSVRQHGPGGTAELNADDGIMLRASFGAGDATGMVALPGRPAARFTAQLASGPAGLYEAGAAVPDGRLQGRWIVGNDGQVAGMLRLNGQPIANPALQPTITVGTSTLTPLAVRQLPTTQPQPRPPVPTPGSLVGRTILAYGPVIDNAFSWRCGGDFHLDGSNFNASASVQVLVNILVPEVHFDYTPPLLPPNGVNGTLNVDFAYILGPRPLNDNKNADVDAVEFPGQSYAVSTHASAYIC